MILGDCQFNEEMLKKVNLNKLKLVIERFNKPMIPKIIVRKIKDWLIISEKTLNSLVYLYTS